jgi:hypothetical protein
MTWSFNAGAIVTFVREDGHPGPGKQETYNELDGWKVEIQDEGCVQIMNWKAKPDIFMVLPWHRIYEIRAV